MNLRYTLGSIIAVPLLPVLYFHGKKIRKSVPTLPEATGNQGSEMSRGGQSIRLLTIGESTIAGVGVATHEEGFTGTLAKTLAQKMNIGVQWRVYARSGYTAKRIIEKILPKIEEQATDIIVVGIGGNDAFTLNAPSKFRSQVIQLIDNLRLRYPNAPIVFANVPPIKEFPAFTAPIKFVIGNLGEILGDEIQKIVAGRDKTYFMSEKLTLDNWIKKSNQHLEQKDFFSDGVHPSKLTYQTWANDVANFIAKENILLGPV
jgi:lysophospholipase L1-like esterase